MRTLFLTAALALLAAGLLPQTAQAQVLFYNYGYPGYTTIPYTSYYYTPGLYAPGLYSPLPSYYEPPYLWSGRYYVNPYTSGFAYERYYPWTNQYFYQYRTVPRWRY